MVCCWLNGVERGATTPSCATNVKLRTSQNRRFVKCHEFSAKLRLAVLPPRLGSDRIRGFVLYPSPFLSRLFGKTIDSARFKMVSLDLPACAVGGWDGAEQQSGRAEAGDVEEGPVTIRKEGQAVLASAAVVPGSEGARGR
jgi:hypothetical protein